MSTEASGTPGVSALVHSLAAQLRQGGVLTAADVAQLRRMDARRPDAPFFKLEGLLLEPHLPGEVAARTELESRWAAVIIGLAHLGELHRGERRLGYALADAGLSEVRFARLVRADAERLVDELPMLARYLAAKGIAADWGWAARLILSAGRGDEEELRRHLARDYFGAIARNSHG